MTTPLAFEPATPVELDSFLVPFDQLNIGDRLRKDYANINDLKKSLLENGQIHAVTVRPTQPRDGSPLPWTLVTGGRRCAAAMMVGWTHIRAENLTNMSEHRQRVLELEENLQRANMTWEEEVNSKMKISQLYREENPQWTDTQTAAHLHLDKGQLSRDIKLAKAIEEHPELLKASSKKAAHRLLDTKRSLAASAARTNTVDMATIENAIRTCDAVEYLEALPDDSVDLFLSDLPFGIDYFDMPASDRKAGGGNSKFDDSLPAALSLVHKIIALMARKVKPEGWICLMISEDLRQPIKSELVIVNTQKLAPGKKLTTSSLPWVWFRPNSRSNPINAHLQAKSMYDLIMPINAGKGVLRKSCENVIVIDSVYEDRVHAHQKPIPLGEELISRFTLVGDTVIDVTMGSGAFIAAAAKTGRKFGGCDLNPDMLPLAQTLVAKHFSNSKRGGDGTNPFLDKDTVMSETPFPFEMSENDAEEFEKDQLVNDGVDAEDLDDLDEDLDEDEDDMDDLDEDDEDEDEDLEDNDSEDEDDTL